MQHYGKIGRRWIFENGSIFDVSQQERIMRTNCNVNCKLLKTKNGPLKNQKTLGQWDI